MTSAIAALFTSAIAALETKRGYKTSKYALAIIRWVFDGAGHGMCKATAGAGKTSMIEDIVFCLNFIANALKKRAPQILALSFGKKIALELQARLNAPNCKSSTLNSLGAGILFKNLKKFQFIDDNDTKCEMIAKGVVSFDRMNKEEEKRFLIVLPAIKRLVNLFRCYGYGAHLDFPTVAELNQIADRYNIDLPEDHDMPFDEFVDLTFRVYDACINNLQIIDYGDQLFMPIRYDMPFPAYYDYVLVDETQDLNGIQTEMLRRVSNRPGCRVLVVGDVYQCIFGFRGSDLEVMDKIESEFSMEVLPLSISYRCSRVAVRRAQLTGSPIESHPGAIEGEELVVTEDEWIEKAKDGDFVLCRTCAPLTKACLDLIRNGKKAFVQGSDMIKNLVGLLNKINTRNFQGSAYDQIDAFSTEMMSKIKDEKKRNALNDKLMTLTVLAEECETIPQVIVKVRTLFKDDQKGIMCATVHRAKGLETNNVFILRPDLIPHPMARLDWEREQENNLMFVATTRTKFGNYWIKPSEAPTWFLPPLPELNEVN